MSTIPRLRLALLLAALLAPSSHALALTLEAPIECVPGRDCFIQNYPDRDPGPGWADYAGGALSYDGHKGVDFFRIPQRALEQGTTVRAAAPGVVKGTRDGMADQAVRPEGLAALAGRECGNGLVIDHGDGLETQYCHMRSGSVAVRQGQRVETGQALGKVGLSGMTEFPHLHFEVRKNGKTLCPFSGGGVGPEAAGPGSPLWSPAALAWAPYVPSGVLGSGFAPAAPPNLNALLSEPPASGPFSERSPVLVFWAAFWGTRQGDELTLRLLAPDGTELVRDVWGAPKNQAQVARLVGRKRGDAPWPAGTYRGEAVLARTGADGSVQKWATSGEIEVR